MKYSKTLGSIGLAALLASGFSGCSENKVLTGYYIDSPVQGVDYSTTSGGAGETGPDGSFQFSDGDTVKFSLGDLVLREQKGLKDGQKLIENEDKVITLLQSIDEDGDPTNGITVTKPIKEKVAEWLGGAKTIALTADKTALANIADLKTKLIDAGITRTKTVTVAQAQTHVQETIATVLASDTTQSLGSQVVVGNTISYIDYKNQVRKAPMSAAAAEYHTGTGFGNTLFDSAENKCQNCHNELYDTWKGSMHGKSWVDPIFQSKFQDFLRVQISKIGTTSDVLYQEVDVGVGSKSMFKSVAQTCIKCHAPGAYYAGDFKVTISEVAASSNLDATELADLKTTHESNLATTTTTYDATKEAVVIASNASAQKIYKATYQIGHKANMEGINCAFCHSIETPRMMKEGDKYRLVKDMRVGPHGPVKHDTATDLEWNKDATNADMNKFFRLWGPEKPTDYASTTKSATDTTGRAADGRYTMASKNIHDENNTHFTGGPFYGPFGLSGKSNENADDTTDRKALANPHFNQDNNHFGNNGKSLCLSCHQRSAGAFDATADQGTGTVRGEFMELCSTQIAVTTGMDTPTEDTDTSPKCQKCHMERIEGNLLHQWARPDLDFDAKEFETAAGYILTPELDSKDTTIAAGENPERDGWFNSHGFLGASKTGGDKTAAVAKIKSGFDATLKEESNDGSTLVLKTTFRNETGHMFPGAHPMRRVLTRVIVTDANGDIIAPTSVTGKSTFTNIDNTLATLTGKNLHSSQPTTVTLVENGSDALNFTGKVADLSGTVTSQRFYSDSGVGKVAISATDATVKSQVVTDGKTSGLVFNSAIVDSNATQKFTRIYGHETGKMYDVDGTSTFVVRPGFDSNKVQSDTRLSPNETETYTLTYDISGKTGVSATYKVYYMQKGANGQFLDGSYTYTAADGSVTEYPNSTPGWLNQAYSDFNKHLVTEVFSDTK
ncbi:hypothetical protein GJV85_01865 [Sulfurimonas aquatica]|uniref:Cytochrome c-552/4 domain-containing protein n=1 Tax=Sulfurimonas aquatica TaxID=2672570 RepID=A0A975AYN0_9BACT|nr:multiheme c-type cytochrome [Sulfurimonas aquatica]QSZ40908.1 hypothetical protein GJV85_01865 [Sulfurimonas aquatica]